MTDSDDLGRSAGEAMEEASEAAASAKDQIVRRASETYGRVADVAKTGYQSTSEQVATWPLSSLIIAVGVGVGLGWALRGSVEENRRSWIDSIYDETRARIRR